MTEIQAIIGRYQLKYLDSQIKKRNQIAKKVMRSLRIFWNKYNLILQPNFNCSGCKLNDLKKDCNNCIHSFYRLNFYVNIDRRKKLKLLNYLQKNNVNCNEGPCPEIYKEKLFKRLKIYPSVKLTNASQLGKKSIAYHINPFITSNKLDRDIKLLRQNLFKCIKIF